MGVEGVSLEDYKGTAIAKGFDFLDDSDEADRILKARKCSAKKKRCIEEVKDKGGDVNPYAVCTESVGE